jgi:glycosyltransferase involved in cell wall biosynthesis
MDIVLASPRFAPQIGGAETYTLALCRELVRRGHRVRVLARGAALSSARIDGIEVERLSSSRIGFGLDVGRAIRAAPPDVVLAQYSALPFAMRAARTTGVPLVAIVHDLYGWADSRAKYGSVQGTLRYLAIERPLRRSPDRILVLTQTMAARVRALLGADQVVAVDPGADHVLVSDRTPDPSCLLFVGRLVPSKGAHHVIDLVRDLRESGRDVRAEIVGSGPEEPALRARAEDLGPAVRFLGAVDDRELAGAFARARMLVLPSVREGWGLVLTEAAVRRVPYVAYALDTVTEQHDLLHGGIVVPSERGLEDAARALLDDPDLAARLGATGQKAAARMTWDATAQQVEATLEEVVGWARRA